MRDFERRALTHGEILIGQSVFGAEIAWAKVRIAQVPSAGGWGAMVPLGRVIYFSKWRAPRDFSQSPHDAQGWFVHELTHVWQAERGTPLALAKLGALGRKAYRVKWREDAALADYNIEAQAEIVRFLFLARLGADVGVKRADLEKVWAARG